MNPEVFGNYQKNFYFMNLEAFGIYKKSYRPAYSDGLMLHPAGEALRFLA